MHQGCLCPGAARIERGEERNFVRQAFFFLVGGVEYVFFQESSERHVINQVSRSCGFKNTVSYKIKVEQNFHILF